MHLVETEKNPSLIAQEINLIKDQAQKFLLQSSIEIGKRLKDAKGLVGHGNWSKWLETEVNYSQRTASNLIKIFDEYGALSIEDSNSKALANLNYTQAVAILRLDDDDRENFLLEVDIDEMSTRELDTEIKDRKTLEKEINQLKEQLQKETEEKGAANTLLQEKIKEIDNIKASINTKSDEIKTLQNQLDETKNIDPEAYQKLVSEVDLKRQEIKNLKKELKAKPKEVEIEVEKTVEVVPESIKQEVASLQSELKKATAKAKATEGTVEFKATFNLLVNLFNQLLDNLEKIKSESTDEYSKYKNAVNELLKKLMITE